MSKTIAVWGSPGAGKTTFAVKTATSLYRYFREDKRVVVAFADKCAPALSYLFPGYKKDNLRSLGAALSKPLITRSDVLRNMVTVPGRKNFAVIGYKDGENCYTYPDLHAEKVKSFIRTMNGIVDYLIIDCVSDPGDPFTVAALESGDILFRVVNPDLKSLSWNASVSALRDEPLPETAVTVVNNITGNVYLPENETFRLKPGPGMIIPYTPDVTLKFNNGRLFGGLNDRLYDNAVENAVRVIAGNEGENEDEEAVIGVFRDEKKQGAEFRSEAI